MGVQAELRAVMVFSAPQVVVGGVGVGGAKREEGGSVVVSSASDAHLCYMPPSHLHCIITLYLQ